MSRILVVALLSLVYGIANAGVIKTIQAGATDQTVVIKIIDSTDGTPETGVVFNTSGIDIEYWRHGANAAVDITEATQTVNGAHADGGFVHIGHGVYRLDLPDAAVASGVTAVEVYGTVTGMIVIGGTVQLTAVNLQDSVRMGMTALPNAAADAAGGLPISDAGGLDLDGLNTNVNDIETDTADMQPKLGTFSDLGAGATLAGNLEDMRDNGTATYDRATDSLQAIRDRGDAAWTTGGSGADPTIQSTTVASVTSQTILVPTATPTFIDQINGWGVYLEDAGDADAYHLTYVTDYNESTGAVTIAEAAPFTVASSDTMVFLPAFMDLGVDVTAWNGTSLATTNPLPNAAAGANGGLPTVDANNRVAGIQGTITTLDGLDTAQDTQHSTTQSAISGLNDLSAAQVNAEVDTALADYDPPTRAELTSDVNGLLTSQRILTGTCDSGSTTTCVDDALTQADATQLEDRLICYDDSWCALITTFNPTNDTATTTKTAPSTRASKAYTIFPSTLE